MKKILIPLILFFFLSSFVNAQNTGSPVSNQPLKIKIKNIFNMNLGSTNTLNLSLDKISDYDNGLEILNANTINYKTTRNWRINVKALSRDFNGAKGTTDMPANVLMVRKNGTESYIPVSRTAQAIATGQRGSGDFDIDYKLDPGYNYDAGTYSITLQYTITNM